MNTNKPSSQYTLALFLETPKALRVGTEANQDHRDGGFWLPASQVSITSSKTVDGTEWATIEIPDWLAEERGLDPSLDGGYDIPDGSLFE